MFSIVFEVECSGYNGRLKASRKLAGYYIVCYIISAIDQQKNLTSIFLKTDTVSHIFFCFSYSMNEVINMEKTKIPQGDEVVTVELTVKELIALTGVRMYDNNSSKISAYKKLHHTLEKTWSSGETDSALG